MQCTDIRSPHLRRNHLCLHHFVCISPFMRRERVLTHCETRFLCVYASVSVLRKPDQIEFSLASSDLSICLLFSYSHILTFLNVLCAVQQVYFSLCPTGSYVHINLPCSRFVLNESLPKSSLPKIFVSFLFVDENVNRFTSEFLSFKKSFRLLSLLSSVKKMSLINYDENYSSTKLTLP